MKYLITGGVGFIGTNTAITFATSIKNSIVLVDDFSRPGVKLNAKYLTRKFANIKIIKANVKDTNKYLSELKKTDVIIHLAGQTAVTTSITNPTLDFSSNIVGGFTLLETVRKYNPKAAVLYSSTNKVYGNLENHDLQLDKKNSQYKDMCHPMGIDENEQLNFISPYGCSKGTIDSYMLDYGRIYGLKTIVFRQSCIYGPFQIGVEDQGWVAFFAKQALAKKPLTVFGDGYQVRDLLYVGDLIDAYSKAIEKIEKIKGNAINVGGGITNSFSLLQVIATLEKKTRHPIQLTFNTERPGDQKLFISANKKAKKILGWVPRTSFHKGLDILLDWQRQYLFNQ